MAIEVTYTATATTAMNSDHYADMLTPVEEGDLGIVSIVGKEISTPAPGWVLVGAPQQMTVSVAHHVYCKWLTPEDGNKVHRFRSSSIGYSTMSTLVIRGALAEDNLAHSTSLNTNNVTSVQVPSITTFEPDTFHLAITGHNSQWGYNYKVATPAGWDSVLFSSLYQKMNTIVHTRTFAGSPGVKEGTSFTTTQAGRNSTFRISLSPPKAGFKGWGMPL